MKEKTEKCLEDRRRGAEDVVCWSGGAAEPGGRRRRARLLPAKGTFAKSQKQKIK